MFKFNTRRSTWPRLFFISLSAMLISGGLPAMSFEPSGNIAEPPRFDGKIEKLVRQEKPEPYAHMRGWHPFAHILKPLWNSTEELDKRISNLEQPVADLKPTLKGLEQHLSGLENKISPLSEQLSGINMRVPALENRMSIVGKELCDLRTDLSALKTEVHNAVLIRKELNRVIDVSEQLRNLHLQIDSVNGNLQDLNEPMSNLKKPLVGVRERVSAANEKLCSVQAQLSAVESNFKGLNQRVDQLGNRLETVQQTVVPLSKNLSVLHKDLSELNHFLEAFLLGIKSLVMAGLFAFVFLFVQRLNLRKK